METRFVSFITDNICCKKLLLLYVRSCLGFPRREDAPAARRITPQ